MHIHLRGLEGSTVPSCGQCQSCFARDQEVHAVDSVLEN